MSDDDNATAGPSSARDLSSSQTSTSDMEEHMICSICCELLYDCVGLQPCMHCFCGGCFSKWLKKSTDCPQCRKTVDRVGPNHMVRNLVQAYLKRHPDKRRPAEEIKQLNAANEIAGTMVLTGGALAKEEQEANLESGPNSDDDEEGSWDDSEDSPDYGLRWPNPKRQRRDFQGPPRRTCRQCPGVTFPPRPTVADGATFACTTNDPPHLLCSCCYELMPDRRHHRLSDATIPRQQCEVCQTLFYCHLYFGGCSNVDNCHGCLTSLSEYHFTDTKISKVVLHNEFESNVVKVYMESKNLTWIDIQRECLTKLDSGVYKFWTDELRPLGLNVRLNSTITTCGVCALSLWSQLAYQYRRDIDPADLPANVTQREDCYWGRKCRTQVKLHHAARFNHICEQTRTR